jgi:hypothetical protein
MDSIYSRQEGPVQQTVSPLKRLSPSQRAPSMRSPSPRAKPLTARSATFK